MKMRSSVFAVVLAIVIATVLCATAMATGIPSPTKDFYIYDGADVIDKDVEKYIIQKNKKLEDKTDAQIVVVTVNSTDDMEIKDFAADIFTEWSIGDKEKKNGLLLLLAIDDQNYWVSQGSGIQDRLTTAKIKTMLDSYLEPYFASGNYSKGVQSVFDKFISSYNGIYSIDVDGTEAEDPSLAKTDGDKSSSPVLTVVIVILVIVLFVAAVIFCVQRFNLIDRYISQSRTRRKYSSGTSNRVNSIQGSRPRSGERTNSNGRRPVQRPAQRPNGVQRQGTSQRPVTNQRPNGAPRQGSQRPQAQSRNATPPKKQIGAKIIKLKRK